MAIASHLSAFIADAKRTPIGRSHPDKGLLRNFRADELLAILLKDFALRMDPADLDDSYIGCVGQHLEQGKNIARLALLLANYPHEVPGVTINRLCASSLQALTFAALTVHGKCGDLIIAGGVEHMDHVPMQAATDYHSDLLARYPFPFNNMGLTAENVAETYGISRQAQDEFALQSHQKAVQARLNGDFLAEIVPLVSAEAGHETIQDDQCPRENTSLERLANLKTVFKEEGTVTAGNSSAIADGASLTLIANQRGMEKLQVAARAQILDFAVVGVDPCLMGMGPVPAISKLLNKQRLRIGDIDLFELNEAFASQAIACCRELDIDEQKLNPTGGAIALGHPLGCTGTRLVTTLVNSLERLDKTLGVAAMCIGHGQGMAVLIRRM